MAAFIGAVFFGVIAILSSVAGNSPATTLATLFAAGAMTIGAIVLW